MCILVASHVSHSRITLLPEALLAFVMLHTPRHPCNPPITQTLPSDCLLVCPPAHLLLHTPPHPAPNPASRRVQKEELPALEYVMQNRVERVNVGVMMAGQGRVADVFSATASFMKERKRKEEEALRAKRKYSPAQEEARR